MLNVIPQPNSIKPLSGRFILYRNSELEFCSELSAAEDIVKPFWTAAVAQQNDSENAGKIAFLYDDALSAEEYVLTVAENSVEIAASSLSGALYGFQTLRQLLKLDTAGADYVSVGCVQISDKPQGSWRGLMLDVSRHFYTLDELHRYIDLMMLHKLNTLHLHLSDDQGWRVEIKKYPLLTEIGSKRAGTAIGGWPRSVNDGKPYSGYYTQDELKDLVKYAAARGVQIVPEIDFPAHAQAIMAAYPQFSCRGEKGDVPWSMGGPTMGDRFENILCAGNDEAIEFLLDVIKEVAAIFPAPYFHVGGDEAPKKRWKSCPKCQKRMKEMGFDDEEQLQGYLNQRVAEVLLPMGKRLMGWNEILKNGKLPDGAVVQYWTFYADSNVKKYVQNGGDIVMSKHQCFYFDMCYAQNPLKRTYQYNPKKFGVNDSEHVLGVEGALWSEWVDTQGEKDVRLFPRLAALAEVGWTDIKLRNYHYFRERLAELFNIYDKLGVAYAEPAVFDPKFWLKPSRMSEWSLKRQDGDLQRSLELRKIRTKK